MTTQLLDTEIKFDRITKDYAVTVCGVIVGFGRTYSEAEAIRTQVLAERQQDGYYHTATLLDGGALDKDGDPAGVDQTDPSAPPDPDPAPGCARPDAGRAIARQWHRDRPRFLTVLRALDRDAWIVLAEAYCAYMARTGTWIEPAHIVRVWAKAVEGDITLPARVHPLLAKADASAESNAGL